MLVGAFVLQGRVSCRGCVCTARCPVQSADGDGMGWQENLHAGSFPAEEVMLGRVVGKCTMSLGGKEGGEVRSPRSLAGCRLAAGKAGWVGCILPQGCFELS